MNPNHNPDYTDDDSPQAPAPQQVGEPLVQPRYNPVRPVERSSVPVRPGPSGVPSQPSVPMPPPPPPPPSPTGLQTGNNLPAQPQPYATPPQTPQASAAPQPATQTTHSSAIPADLHLVDTPNTAVNSRTPVSPRPQPGINSLFKSMAKVLSFLVVVFAGAALLNAFVFQTYYVNGHSMQPTLEDSDRLIVNKVPVTRGSISGTGFIPERGDVIVISSLVSSFTAARNEQIIKRVIALPGERVVIERGTVTVYPEGSEQGINADQELDLQLTPTYSNQPIDIVVPENSVYVLGDNRGAGNSYDSRDFGPVSIGLIEGTLWVRVLPLNQIRAF